MPLSEVIQKKKEGTSMKYINLTPHEIHLLDKKGNTVRYIEPSGMVARVKGTKYVLCETQHNIPLYQMKDGEDIHYLPQPKENTIFIVSTIVLRAIKGKRSDVFAPYETKKFRHNIKACYGLYQFKATETEEDEE